MPRRGVRLGRMEFTRDYRLVVFKEKGARRVEMQESAQLSSYIVSWRIGKDRGEQKFWDRGEALRFFTPKTKEI